VRELLALLRNRMTLISPSELLDEILEKTGYREGLRAEDSPEADARLENLEELIGSIDDYEAEARAAGEEPSLAGYLERVTLQSDVDGMKDAPRVTLMTVHGAKGLEFEVVLLTGMEEEMFPYRGLDPGGDEELEEERRLAYVAITRARTRLVMTWADTRQIFGMTRWGRPSRFIGDLPADAVEQLATKARGAGGLERFIDRAAGLGQRGGGYVSPGGPWRHPQANAEAPRAAGERFVDKEFFADAPHEDDAVPLRRGSRVLHARFGEGEVRRIESSSEPAVVAFFPGWGEKKILARFLKVP